MDIHAGTRDVPVPEHRCYAGYDLGHCELCGEKLVAIGVPDHAIANVRKRIKELHEHLIFLLDLRSSYREREVNQDVHTEHCCVVHGCEYSWSLNDEGDGFATEEQVRQACSVLNRTKRQSHTCETCDGGEY